MAAEKYIRPQKHNSWFNVLPIKDLKKSSTNRYDFLDTFVTVDQQDDGSYFVLLEGQTPLIVEEHFGFLDELFSVAVRKEQSTTLVE